MDRGFFGPEPRARLARGALRLKDLGRKWHIDSPWIPLALRDSSKGI